MRVATIMSFSYRRAIIHQISESYTLYLESQYEWRLFILRFSYLVAREINKSLSDGRQIVFFANNKCKLKLLRRSCKQLDSFCWFVSSVALLLPLDPSRSTSLGITDISYRCRLSRAHDNVSFADGIILFLNA